MRISVNGFMVEVSVASMEGPVALRTAERERWRSVTTFLQGKERSVSYDCLRPKQQGLVGEDERKDRDQDRLFRFLINLYQGHF